MTMSKPLPLHVRAWEAMAMFAGHMTRKRVPSMNRWTPRGQTESILTRRPFARGIAGDLFWVAEPFVWLQGQGSWEAMEHVNYSHDPRNWTPKPPQVPRWKSERGDAQDMRRTISRMTVEIVGARPQHLVEISDADVEAEGLAVLDAGRPRSRFMAEYLEAYGVEFTSLKAECTVVSFTVHKMNVNAILRQRGAA